MSDGRRAAGLLVLAALAAGYRAGAQPTGDATAVTTLAPGTFARAGTVDERFQSYNVEMVEVTGGRFWKPYADIAALLQKDATAPSASPSPGTPTGVNPALFQYRPPIDLADPRLRKLAAGLGPAYVRVSGTWANSTYFPESETAPSAPPAGFGGVLTRAQWKGVLDFARAVDARIVTSFATSVGTRDETGAWTPAQARRFVEATQAIGGTIAAAEFMNEPNLAEYGGTPPGYDAAAYGRDFKIFRSFAKQAAPDMLILGPGSVAEAGLAASRGLKSRDLLAAAGPGVDGFSYHHYGTVSKRCSGLGVPQMTPAEALSEEWLTRTDATLAFYRALRDEFEPGKPLWLTETADAACGGNPWGASFLDTFRYLDQLGRLARQGVQVVMHNTLAASDYGMVDEKSLAPRPNYWGALLWRRLMGATVLDPHVPLRAGLHVYAHCLRGVPGGVAVLALSTDRTAPATLRVPARGERYTLASDDLESVRVALNGTVLALDGRSDLPRTKGTPVAAGEVKLAPATITFLAFPDAGNGTCR
jgi:heparanase